MKLIIQLSIILLLLELFLSSCRTIRYIPIETTKTEYKTRDSIRFDSIYNRDSIYVLSRGDTVYLYKYKYLYKYSTITRTDTVIRTDSIQIPYIVEKQLTHWQTLKQELGGWAFGIIIFIVLIFIGWMVYKWHTRKF